MIGEKYLHYHLRIKIGTMFDLGERFANKIKRLAIRKIVSKRREIRTVAIYVTNIYKIGLTRLTNQCKDRRIVKIFEKRRKTSIMSFSVKKSARILMHFGSTLQR